MTFYSDYVAHMLRFYLRYPKPSEYDHQVDHTNWNCVDTVMQAIPEREREFITKLYGEKRTGQLDVAAVAYDEGLTTLQAWDIIKRTQARIARARGLI